MTKMIPALCLHSLPHFHIRHTFQTQDPFEPPLWPTMHVHPGVEPVWVAEGTTPFICRTSSYAEIHRVRPTPVTSHTPIKPRALNHRPIKGGAGGWGCPGGRAGEAGHHLACPPGSGRACGRCITSQMPNPTS